MRYFLLIFCSLLVLIAPVSIDAATQDVPGSSRVEQDTPGTPAGSNSVTIQSPLKVSSIADLFATILEVLLIFMVPVIVFFIIYAGYLYVTARGNVDQITQAHRALLYALVGGLLILGGKLLIDVIQGTVDAVIK